MCDGMGDASRLPVASYTQQKEPYERANLGRRRPIP